MENCLVEVYTEYRQGLLLNGYLRAQDFFDKTQCTKVLKLCLYEKSKWTSFFFVLGCTDYHTF